MNITILLLYRLNDEGFFFHDSFLFVYMSAITCTVQDYKGATSTVRVIVGTANATPAKAQDLANFIATHSDAKVIGYGVALDYTGDSTDSGKYDRVLQSLRLLYEDQDGKARRFSIPAPRDEDVNVDQEPDSDVAEDVKDLLVALGAGTAFTYNGGGLDSRMPPKNARAKVMTGV